ncbi:DsbA family protein [Phototrophicus methaneseepsis]|uniref:DsbA family protein n=1 Tax=Phototrophicus methaneseepsis TaxID=2710758 RepID=A0A7S8E9Z5_9CHLR|nr:DsbA family protein [Phototrophicus methaneseepsis]QPC83107.1 DsbA family protein [Phototrophicus methaneseepsis]
MEEPSAEQTDDMTTNDEQTLTNHVSYRLAVVASICLLVGIFIGAVGYGLLIQSQRTMIEEVVATQLAGQDQRIADQVLSSIMDGVRGGQPQPVEPGAGPRSDVSADDDPGIGSPDAPIVMIEFSDFQCPYCGRFATTTLDPILETYGDYIYFVYRDFPILGPESTNAAIAAQCADEQEQFWAFHDLLFDNQQNLNRATYLDFAGQLNLDIDTFTGCLDNETYLEEVQQDAATAQQLGATGTPTFFINGRYVSGAQPFDFFARIIEEELAAAGIEGQ